MADSAAPSNAVTGIVVNQAMPIFAATPQRTFDRRSAEPTPTMAELTTCVVLTGPPNNAMERITPDEAICVLNPSMGRILYNLPPSVLMSRQPPRKAPNAIAAAQATTTHCGT